MSQWYMLTVVGKDQVGIVSALTKSLLDLDCNLGEASMIRLGGNFTIMLMVQSSQSLDTINQAVTPVVKSMGLKLHADEIEPGLHSHLEPDVSITVSGADRAGIVSEVAGILAETGVNIIDLESAVAGTEAKPLYILHVEGVAEQGIEVVEQALDKVRGSNIDVSIHNIETIIG